VRATKPSAKSVRLAKKNIPSASPYLPESIIRRKGSIRPIRRQVIKFAAFNISLPCEPSRKPNSLGTVCAGSDLVIDLISPELYCPESGASTEHTA
jgi:hypothetical protein